MLGDGGNVAPRNPLEWEWAPSPEAGGTTSAESSLGSIATLCNRYEGAVVT